MYVHMHTQTQHVHMAIHNTYIAVVSSFSLRKTWCIDTSYPQQFINIILLGSGGLVWYPLPYVELYSTFYKHEPVHVNIPDNLNENDFNSISAKLI